MNNEITIPKVLIEQKDFCIKINESNLIISEHVDYLRRLILDMHKVYQKLCTKTNQISQHFEKQSNSQKQLNNHASIVSRFIFNLNFVHTNINNQLNDNNVMIGTKTHKIMKHRFQILQEKLLFSDNLNKEFFSKVNTYNIKQKKFRIQCQYFKDYEQDVMKYYALKANTTLYEYLSGKQLKLKEKIEDIARNKDQYLINISQIRITINQFYEREINMINQYKKLILSVRKQSIQKPNANLPIIQEQMEESYSEISRKTQKGKHFEKDGKEKSIVQQRKDIQKQYERGEQLQILFQEFLKEYRSQLIFTGQRIDKIREGAQYQKFKSQKLVVNEIIPIECIRDIESILNEITFFRELILKIQMICGKIKVISELRKYRGNSYQKFLQDTNPYLQRQRKLNFSSQLKIQYEILQQKYKQSYMEYNNRYIDLINELQQLIIKTLLAENNPYQEKVNKQKKNIKINLFEKKYYEILMHSFFLNHKEHIIVYHENQYLKKFIKHLNANKIQNMVTLNGFFNKARHKIMKTTCCGLIKRQEVTEAPQLLDHYMCALKDDSFLCQGKLKLYEKYIKFSSTFNSKTLFGYTDIRIPLWDIIEFIKEKHMLSFMMHIKTTHGSLYFTNFLTFPYERILQLYSETRQSGVNINNKSKTSKELRSLQERFQSELYQMMNNYKLVIDKLSTYMSKDGLNLSICIEYHENKKQEMIMFEIKFRQKKFELEYIFIHDENNKSQESRQLLERISTQLINYQTVIKTHRQNLPNTSLQFNLDYSIIQQKERNKISFIKEPSFLRRSQSSNILNYQQNNKNNQASFLHLLSSKNFLTNNETQNNIQKEEPNNNVEAQSSNSHTKKQEKVSNQFPLKNDDESQRTMKKQRKTAIMIQKSSFRQKGRMTSHRDSNKSKSVSRDTQWIIDYKTILLFIGILFGINLMLNFMK